MDAKKRGGAAVEAGTGESSPIIFTTLFHQEKDGVSVFMNLSKTKNLRRRSIVHATHVGDV